MAALSSQRRSSSLELAPEAKRSRINDGQGQRWLESVVTPPFDGLESLHHPHSTATATSTSLSHSLNNLEYSDSWSSYPSTTVNSTSLDFLPQRPQGVQTNFHPTPLATPQHQSFNNADRPINHRSTTAPVTSSKSLAEIEAAHAVGGGGQFGAEIEMRTRVGGEHHQAVARSQTDPGFKAGAFEPLNKDRFVAGLVGESFGATRPIR